MSVFKFASVMSNVENKCIEHKVLIDPPSKKVLTSSLCCALVSDGLFLGGPPFLLVALLASLLKRATSGAS